MNHVTVREGQGVFVDIDGCAVRALNIDRVWDNGEEIIVDTIGGNHLRLSYAQARKVFKNWEGIKIK
jgi:hypothetical protein